MMSVEDVKEWLDSLTYGDVDRRHTCEYYADGGNCRICGNTVVEIMNEEHTPTWTYSPPDIAKETRASIIQELHSGAKLFEISAFEHHNADRTHDAHKDMATAGALRLAANWLDGVSATS